MGGGLKTLSDMSTKNVSFFGTAPLIANTYNINTFIHFIQDDRRAVGSSPVSNPNVQYVTNL